VNVAGYLAAAARQHGESEALRFGDVSRSYAELHDRAGRLAAGLAALGLEPGDRVALLQANGPELVESMFGAWLAGLAVVPINSRAHPREAVYMAENCEASAIIHGDEYEAGLREALATTDSFRLISLASGGLSLSFDEVLDRGCPIREPVERDGDDLAWLFYTSGTTGRPKGAMLSHRNLRQAVGAHLADARSFQPGEAVLHAAPLSHGSGHVMLSCVARASRNLIYPGRSFDGDQVLRLIADEGVASVAFLAPTQIVVLNRAASEAPMSLPLESVCYGGAPMLMDDLRQAISTFGQIFFQLYGQGESPMTITGLSPADHARFLEDGDPRFGSVGVPRINVEVRAGDADGKTLPAGETGEIMVRGDVVMKGYWGNAEATAASIRDGWLWTGDIGRFDETGYLYLLDRSKDMIISGGNNIYPREVEEAIQQMAAVRAVAVIGLPDDYWGEAVHAVIVPEDGAEISAEDVIEHCRSVMASYKKPKTVEFVTALPTNAYGKVSKRHLRAQHSKKFST
jgi:acyl-CoA synthetase (AMP-forming)/AMP-acid ligase II